MVTANHAEKLHLRSEYFKLIHIVGSHEVLAKTTVGSQGLWGMLPSQVISIGNGHTESVVQC